MPFANYIRRPWAYRNCSHDNRRCVHGDEINAVGGKRSQCLRCDRFLSELPRICSVTGQPHLGDRLGEEGVRSDGDV